MSCSLPASRWWSTPTRSTFSPSAARRPREDWILTPHPGEAGRLLGVSAQDIQHDRLAALDRLLERFHGTIVLKGAGTLVGARGRIPGVCERGNPGMATAGTGDVLTGAIAGILAQCHDHWAAARVGVLVHAMAGDAAARAGRARGAGGRPRARAAPLRESLTRRACASRPQRARHRGAGAHAWRARVPPGAEPAVLFLTGRARRGQDDPGARIPARAGRQRRGAQPHLHAGRALPAPRAHRAARGSLSSAAIPGSSRRSACASGRRRATCGSSSGRSAARAFAAAGPHRVTRRVERRPHHRPSGTLGLRGALAAGTYRGLNRPA